MFEGRGNAAGWTIVGAAVVALIVFTGLLYVRGGSGAALNLTRADASPVTAAKPSASPRAPGNRAPAATSRPASSAAGASVVATSRAVATGAVAGATSSPSSRTTAS